MEEILKMSKDEAEKALADSAAAATTTTKADKTEGIVALKNRDKTMIINNDNNFVCSHKKETIRTFSIIIYAMVSLSVKSWSLHMSLSQGIIALETNLHFSQSSFTPSNLYYS